ncbi:MAG: glucose-methanol-choline oxidoreductase, partial [Geminicoccaceae bacterium]|nr:glucose-methanol-choline oxidoreductase [Geminicoccaceae bacterium]
MIFPQGRVLGGGSSINAMVYARGHALDYDEWAREEGCVGWSYADVLPYFRRAEDNERFANRFHGTGGPLGVCDLISPHYLTRAFVRAAQEAGLPYNPDFNGERQEGCGLYQVTQRGARRCSAAVGYLKPALARGNLTVLTGARAEQEVVVASGAVGSPRLLLLSGIGPADELERVGVTPLHDLQGVGRNLQDHIDVYVICELAGPHSYDRHTRPHRMLWAGVQYLLFGNGPVTSNLAEGGAFWYADSEQRS